VSIYRESPLKLWVIALIFTAPLQVLALVLDGPVTFWIWALLSLPANAWMIGVIVNLVVAEAKEPGPGPSVGRLVGSAWSRLAPLTLLTFVTFTAVAFGLGFLIVPGLFLAVIWIISFPAMLIEGIGVSDSLYRSFELTRGNRMRILPLVLFFLVAEAAWLALGIGPDISPVVISALGLLYAVLVYPFVVIVSTVLYFQLAGD